MKRSPPSAKKKAGIKPAAAMPALLSGGNPQIEKADGDAPVEAYIAAMPGWQRDVGRRIDKLVVRVVPGVRKAVKWNSPFYGIDGQGWFLAIHCFTTYVKIAFFRGTSLQPLPPGSSKQKDVRYVDIHEDDEFDEAQLAAWVKQASRLPGNPIGAERSEALGMSKATTTPVERKSNREDVKASPSQRIDARITYLDDWRGEMLARVRAVIKKADPDVVETWKWRGVPVWEHDGIICTGET